MTPPLTPARRAAIDRRRRVLEAGLLACYEIIDGIRKEMAELDAEVRTPTPPEDEHRARLLANGYLPRRGCTALAIGYCSFCGHRHDPPKPRHRPPRPL
jgi:hypothetical protein